MASGQLPSSIKKALREELDLPRIEELVSHFFHQAGGVRAVAQLLYDEFMAAKPGSLMRQRIMDIILRQARYASDRLADGGDMSLVNEADLERKATELIRKLPDLDHESSAAESGATATASSFGAVAQAAELISEAEGAKGKAKGSSGNRKP